MATEEFNNGLSKQGGDYLISEERQRLVIQSGHELEQIGNYLLRMSPTASEEYGYLMRGMALRIKDLGQVVMSGLCDEVETMDTLEHKVNGFNVRDEVAA